MPLLFAYGTLQDASVQLAVFGRAPRAHADALPGYERASVPVADQAQVAGTGHTHHANLVPSARPEARVAGTVLEVTDAELGAVDDYERTTSYARTRVTLASGAAAWVYVHVAA